MHRFMVASLSAIAAVSIAMLIPRTGSAEETLPTPPRGFQPPPPAPVKPYKQVAVTPPGPFTDASFVAFRKTLAGIAARKDRAALAKLVVSTGFFWIQQDDIADHKKSGIDNLAKAVGLDAKDGSGWDVIAAVAAEPTAAEAPQQKGLICAPASPTFDAEAFNALLQQSDTDPTEWAYPVQNGVEVRNAAQPTAPVVEKLGLYLVRVLGDSPPPDSSGASFAHVALPSGKTGFVATSVLAPLATDQICYSKQGSDWKIAGFIGGASQ